jgi:hypothetical protein
MSVYTEYGYENRRDYLESLADDLGIDKQTVFAIAGLLGASEDFDGLVTTLEDYSITDED